MNFWTMAKHYASVQTRTSIPSAVYIHTCIQIYCDSVFFSKSHIICQVYITRRITVMLTCNLAAVYVNACVHHGSVKLKTYAVIFPFLWDCYVFCIICGVAFKISAVRFCRRICRYRCSNHPVMRQIYFFRFYII